MAKKKTAPKKTTALARKDGPVPAVSKLATEIRDLIETARSHVSTTANLAMVNLYWNIGRVITQEMQKDESRAEYGEKLVERLGSILSQDYGSGFSARNLWDMKRFFGEFQILQPVSAESAIPPIRSTVSNESQIQQTASAELVVPEICEPLANKSLSDQILQTPSAESCERLQVDFRRHFRLGWSHYRLLLGQKAPLCRKFYFEQAAEQRWTVRELRRQIDRGLFERVALSRDTRRLVAQEKRKGPAEIVRYEDIFKDPYVLDFLGLKGAYSEKDLEAAIIHNLEQFLIELGTDFCFVGRQHAMRIDDDDYSLDLLFYHRGLRCLVAIDLKLGTFTAADKGQMDLYLAWLKEHDWRAGENEPVGLILCTSARHQHVELLLRHGPHKMKVAEYLTYLPDKRLLEERLKMYGRLLKEQNA
jgi:predicted nuclease of restriction endonuclease-like (RecB) superfamily